MDGTASTPVKLAKVPGELPAAKYTRQTITWIKRWNDHLFSFRITRDAGYRFKPGQFARLGVYRDDGAKGPRYIWRAYSIVSADYDEFLEFYSIVVPDGDFTTKLAELREGDQILIEKMSYGFRRSIASNAARICGCCLRALVSHRSFRSSTTCTRGNSTSG